MNSNQSVQFETSERFFFFQSYEVESQISLPGYRFGSVNRGSHSQGYDDIA